MLDVDCILRILRRIILILVIFFLLLIECVGMERAHMNDTSFGLVADKEAMVTEFNYVNSYIL
jgi:hypothetical protein